MGGGSKIRLIVPRQDLAEFSLFTPTPQGAEDWARTLPVVNTQAAALLLVAALADLNHFCLPPEVRYQIVETLRPNLDSTLTSLCKRYLNQPLVIPEEPGRMAALAEDLVTAASTAYTVVAVETIRQRDAIHHTSPARLACEAILHALDYARHKVLQAFQLYKPLPMHSWQTLHQLYALAKDQQLEELPVQGAGSDSRSIKSTYLQALILSCCKPNQLRQSDLELIDRALSAWSELVTLEDSQSGTGLFLVDLKSDQPPRYASLWPDPPEPDCHFINTERLAAHLRELKKVEPEAEPGSEDSRAIPAHLLDHLINSLGRMSLRNFGRTASSSPLRVCIGLSSTHYHVAGRKDFEYLVAGRAEALSSEPVAHSNPFMRSPDKADVWQEANPEKDYIRNEWLPGQEGAHDSLRSLELDERTRSELLEEVEVELPLDQRYPVFKVQLADASPGGYCLQWSDELPGEIHSGDIVSLKEEQSSEWVIAVIRWLSRFEDSHSLIGLELLSPYAMAFGAQIHGKDGAKSAPMRVLLLPEIKLVGQPHTLITPRTSFREQQRVTLINRQDRRRAQLLRKISSTAGYTQFEFKYIEELGDVLANEQRNPQGSLYDSLWSNI